MSFKLFNKPVAADFAVVDSQFPQKDPLAFRNAEINEYFKKIKNAGSYTMHPMQPDGDAWFTHGYGVSLEEFEENKRGYLGHYPENASRIHYLEEGKNYKFRLAYSYFLAETYVLLPFYEKHAIPFVFILYPGGAFGLDNDKSDTMLKKIFASQYFKGVIVTQRLTKDYLLRKELCPEEKITFIYGGIVQFKTADVKPKRFYKRDKDSFDICFVAAKYSEQGIDKGYDLFIDTAKLLSRSHDDFRFHVVGGFDEHDIDVSDIRSRITFYGYRRPDFLSDFYSGMDIFLSPNRPYKLFDGNFDGFPLGADAGYCGTAMFVSDELGMNVYYKNEIDIQTVPLNANDIADTIRRYFTNLEALYALSLAGQQTTQRLFDLDFQVTERMKLFQKFTSLELTTAKQ